MRKIAFVGPESTGKTVLSKALAEKHNAVWVEEYARTYLTKLTRKYNIDDLDIIAQNQYNLIENCEKTDKLCFIDTELITIKIWSEYKFKQCSRLVIDLLKKQKIDRFFLCKPDFPWVFDPLREAPSSQNELFEIYESELNKHKINYSIVGGNLDERIMFAEKEIIQ